jgi:HD superfamily phosphohydrolase
MNTIEQIVICKLMLFSYIYHHAKCRAAEGMLVRVLEGMVRLWRASKETDAQILERFLNMTDSDLRNPIFRQASEPWIQTYAYRLINRLLPREVYRLGGAIASHAERALLADFLITLQDKQKRDQLICGFEQAIGEELLQIDSTFGKTPQEALRCTGVWVDVPKVPKFEDIHELVTGRGADTTGVPLAQLFPIDEWTQAYTHFRYYVRIYSFSEHWDKVQTAAKKAMQKIIKIESESFYDKAKRTRF